IPESVTFIREWAFEGCSSLKSITIPEGITKIEARLFKGSPLENVELPETLTEVGEEAFYGTKSFLLTSENCTLTLPVPPSRHKTENDSCNEKIPQFIIEKDLDKKWEIVVSMKKAPLKHMLSAFMTLAYDHAAAKTYLKRSIKKAMQTFIDMQDVDFITDVLNLGFVTMKNFDEIFAYLNAKREDSYTEMKIVFLNYKHDHIGYQTAAE
ncbi:MAG: leucine-rich repeat domain-containing protein, partial [Ruminococcus sp.]|nr:leucine-rich repeat domain-containing protein [Ruminococcus sp.]